MPVKRNELVCQEDNFESLLRRAWYHLNLQCPHRLMFEMLVPQLVVLHCGCSGAFRRRGVVGENLLDSAQISLLLALP